MKSGARASFAPPGPPRGSQIWLDQRGPRGTFRERRWSKLRVAPGERLGAVSVASGTYHGLGFFRNGIRTAPPGGDHLSSPPCAGSGVLALDSGVVCLCLVFLVFHQFESRGRGSNSGSKFPVISSRDRFAETTPPTLCFSPTVMAAGPPRIVEPLLDDAAPDGVAVEMQGPPYTPLRPRRMSLMTHTLARAAKKGTRTSPWRAHRRARAHAPDASFASVPSRGTSIAGRIHVPQGTRGGRGRAGLIRLTHHGGDRGARARDRVAI